VKSGQDWLADFIDKFGIAECSYGVRVFFEGLYQMLKCVFTPQVV